MPKLRVRGIAFDMYGTIVDVAAVAEACRAVAADPTAFAQEWRAKQLEYSFLRTLLDRYQDFWTVSGQALEFVLQRHALVASPAQRRHLLNAWLQPTPYPDAKTALPRLAERYPLAILSNGSPRMLRIGLARTGLRRYFRWVISVDRVRRFKPSPIVYQLAPRHMRLRRADILFVSSNSFDVVGARAFGFQVCWINRTGAPLDVLGVKPTIAVASFDELSAALEPARASTLGQRTRR
jgi:2-haloacid dehalogenase